MKVTDTELQGVKIFEFSRKKDARGFQETMIDTKFMKECGINFCCLEQRIYHAASMGTFYGIHFQDNKHPQAKLIYCLKGRGMDYIVDLQKDSATYKKWIAIEIEENDNCYIYIPQGYGHAFLALEDDTQQLFSIDEYFYEDSSMQIRYDDPDIGIQYKIPIGRMSDYDKNAPYLRNMNIRENEIIQI